MFVCCVLWIRFPSSVFWSVWLTVTILLYVPLCALVVFLCQITSSWFVKTFPLTTWHNYALFRTDAPATERANTDTWMKVSWNYVSDNHNFIHFWGNMRQPTNWCSGSRQSLPTLLVHQIQNKHDCVNKQAEKWLKLFCQTEEHYRLTTWIFLNFMYRFLE